MAKPTISVVGGDITQIPADALMTAINSGGLWFGGIDRAIQKVAGNMYHSQVERAQPLRDLQTVVAKGTGPHRGKFKDVVFVIDDLESSLDRVIYFGLQTANRENYKYLLIPTIRMGVMAGVKETPEEAVIKMAGGLNEFVKRYSGGTNLENIKFVVYNNPSLVKDMSSVLSKI